ncbi:MAG: aldo/keto reductase [Burkholderiales bacterium]|nr:aldo/keto reductase [Burkholderiales bacterium]MDE2453295.1 aldo/keto reductase [Burkholderiales bacterium]
MRLALGTVQFGLAYGIAGRGQAMPESEVRSVLESAAAQGVRTLDTAAAYGDIESRLARLAAGLALEFVSKVPAIPPSLDPDGAAEFALCSARTSQERLGEGLRALMLHSSADFAGERGEAVAAALAPWARSAGVTIGASCYAPAEALELARQGRIGIAQVPGNALDQRIAEPGVAQGLGGVEIHLRSALLQGLLVMPPARAQQRLAVAAPALRRWHAWCAAQGMPPLVAALSVAKSFAAVSAVVIGVDSLEQWNEVARAWQRAEAKTAAELACADPAVVDPRRWSLEP